MIVRGSGNAVIVDGQDVATHPAVLGGRYELGALLGSGASAVVRRALDRVSGRTFAVKLFHAGASSSDRRRQQREMSALAALHHPGLVGLHDGGVEADRPYIVTDLVEGQSLAERIAERPLDAAEVLRLGARLADALAHVHANGIVHRDLKPANVLMDVDGRPRLADFGIARAVDGTAVTGTGYVIGTAAYLAPEQVRGEWVGPEADVYALGLVLLESLKGHREYPGALVESATARLYRAPGIPEELPSALRSALHAMTALEPAARPTAARVAAMLGAGSSRRGREGGFGRGLHRRRGTDSAHHRGTGRFARRHDTGGHAPVEGPAARGRHAVPGTVGLVAALAVAATVTATALPSATPRPAPSGAVLPAGVGGSPAGAASPAAAVASGDAAVSLDRVPATLGDSVDAARVAALARSFDVRGRASTSARPAAPPRAAAPSDTRRSSADDDRPGRHRAADDD